MSDFFPKYPAKIIHICRGCLEKIIQQESSKTAFLYKIKFIFWFSLFTIFFIVNPEFFCIIYTLVCFLAQAFEVMENAYNFPDLLFYMTS